MAIEHILSKKHSRRAFYSIFGLLATLLFVVRFVTLPTFIPGLATTPWEVVASLTDKLLISLIVTIGIGAFIFWLTPDVMRQATIEAVDPREIPELFSSALQTSEHWWYSGGCGRYFRSTTLPEMAKHARNRSLRREITGLILDPIDEKLCQNYANYRRGVKSAEGDTWDLKRVRQELVATIIKAAAIKHEEPLLRVKLSLVNQFSTIRYDMSDKYMILTKEDKTAPALRFDEGSYFYKWYRDELVIAESQARQVPDLPPAIATADVTIAHARTVASQVGLQDGYFLPSELENIVTLVKHSRNPYA